MKDREPMRLVLTDVVGSEFCVSIEDGQTVHGVLADLFDRGEPVTVSFEGVKRLTTAFLNAAIGQLYNEYPEEEVRRLLRPPEDASQEQLRLLKRVVDNAKSFFAERMRGPMRDELGDD